jgi:hypothetical protein
LAAIACLVCAACGVVSPTPTPTAAPPTPTVAPRATPLPTLDPATFDIQDAFLTNVNDLTSDVETLASAQCAELTAETQAHPTELSDMRGFATTLQRVASTQAALNSDDVRGAIADLGKALSQLDSTLATCGIKTP